MQRYFDKDDIAALTVLLARQVMAQDERAAAEEAKRQAEERLVASANAMKNCRASFAAFDFDTSSPDLWNEVKEAMGEDAWNAAFLRARPPVHTVAPQITDEGSSGQNPAESSEQRSVPMSQDGVGTSSGDGDSRRKTVRELLIELLPNYGDLGAKAAELRRKIEAIQGQSLHEKTVGMTLYRLSKDGLVRRDGRKWVASTAVLPPSPNEGTEEDFQDLLGA
jgi:hypothetical protein